MKASERLRALDEAMTAGPWPVPRDAVPDDFDSHTELRRVWELRNALPELVAVVEAAENVTFHGQEAHRYNEWHGSRIVLALDALAAKLNPEEVT